MMQKEINLIQNEVEKVISGKTEVIRKILMAILAEGHILLDDVPGVGKTTMAVSFGENHEPCLQPGSIHAGCAAV